MSSLVNSSKKPKSNKIRFPDFEAFRFKIGQFVM